jgi:RNA-directed DNA polymerase
MLKFLEHRIADRRILRLIRHWLFALRRRSHKHRLPWERFGPLANRLIPNAKILHPYPNVRFYAKHPR